MTLEIPLANVQALVAIKTKVIVVKTESTDPLTSDPAPDSKQQRTIFEAIHKITTSMKGAGASEISEIGPNEAQSGPEKWTVCSRAHFSNEVRYFTFFVKGETVASWRPSVINDRCETRRFSSF